jgi:hypothetical protein
MLREHRQEAATTERGKLEYGLRHIVQTLNMEVGVVRARPASNKVLVSLSREVTEKLRADLSQYY